MSVINEDVNGSGPSGGGVMEPPRQNNRLAVHIDVSKINGVAPTLLTEFASPDKSISGPPEDRNTLSRIPDKDAIPIPEKPQPKERLPDKIFQNRVSVLTDLFETNHCRSLYHILITVIISIYLDAIVGDLVKHGKVNLGFDLLSWSFSQWPQLLILWIGMQLATLIVYWAVKLWATLRVRYLSGIMWAQKLCDFNLAFLLLLYQTAYFVIPSYQVRAISMPVATAGGILIEQIRLSVKMYSFVRTIVPRVTSCSNHNKNCDCVPSFSKFFYFLFVPTLIYKDEYPRNSKIRFGFLLARLVEVFVLTLFAAFLMDRHILPPLKNFRSVQETPVKLVAAVCSNFFPSLVFFLVGFYGFYHSGFNAVSEILRFGDRLSYRDWWNSSSFASFYRTWNLPVQNWLYLYVYRDTYDIFQNRTLSTMLVFVVSAIFHDYVLAITVGFYYPVLFFMFGLIGTVFAFVQIKEKSQVVGNAIFWVMLCIGSGILISLYVSEYYARIHCPQTIESQILDFFVPRSWTCSMVQE